MQQYSSDVGGTYDDWYDRRERRTRTIAIGFVGALVLAGVIAGLIWWHARTHPAIVPAPTGYTTFTASDKGFQVSQPDGWKVDESSSMGLNSGVNFKAGPCKITVASDLAGSLMGDIAASQNAQAENIASQAGIAAPATVPPVEKLHEAGKQDMANELPGYSEQAMETFDCPAGQGRVSEFTSDDGGNNPIDHLHGYRATILNLNRRIQVVEICPEQNWTILYPAFRQVLQSVTVPPQS